MAVPQQKAKKREAQMRALALIAQGHTVATAMATVGRATMTWQKWREEPWFAARADQIRGRQGEGEASPFTDFRRAYFGFDTYWHQQQIVDSMEKAQGMEITLVLLPPFWGKSTVLEDWITYVLAVVEPDHRFCIISESQAQARKMIGRIQRRMTDDSQYYEFISRYGPFKTPDRAQSKPWNVDYFTVLRAGHDERDYSVEARGAGSKLYGSRYDTIFCDDIQSLQSLNGTEHLYDFIRSDLVTRPGSEGRMVFVGTRVGPGDIYEKMLEDDFVDHLVKIPALDEEGHSLFPAVYDKDGKRLMAGRDPLGWDEKQLQKRRQQVGEETWARVYMQEPQSKVGAPFTEAAIARSLDETRAIGDIGPGMGILASIDPALSGYASIKVCSYDAKHLWLVDTANIQAPGRYEELFDLIDDFSNRWKPSEWVVEVNAMQKGLARDDRIRSLADRHGFRIVEHTTRANKMDTAIGVASMADGFRRGDIVLPDRDEPTKRQMAQLIKELRAWRPDIPTRYLRQDEVMALWFCYLRWTQIRRTLETASRDIRIGGTPWTPTGYPTSRAS